MLALAIALCVFATSLLSGIVGMAGGIVLLAVLIATLPTTSAMILHGFIQAVANGSRAWFIREHVQWRLLPIFFAGVALVAMVFALIQIVWSAPVILIAIGAIAWLTVLMPKRLALDVTRPLTTFMCGLSVTAAQLLVGTSGPLLDAFFQKNRLNRFEVVATKAFTQTVGHLVKIGYFTWLALQTSEPMHHLLNGGYLLVLPLASLAGTRIGTWLLHKIDETHFRRLTSAVLLVLGVIVAVHGITQLSLSSAG